MENLSLRLTRVSEAGMYRLDCREQDLHAAIAETGYSIFRIDLEIVRGKEDFMAVVARAINVPDWFGNNWDALSDTLCDFSWQPSPGYVLLLCHGNDMFGMNTGDYRIAMEIFSDTIEFWRSQDKPFWIFFDHSIHEI